MNSSVVVVTGGVGGAKLALGLERILPHGSLTIVVNTGDDFDHLGLRICPDIDTTLYTLSGLANRELGWGRQDESWHFMETLEALGGDAWFNLGDRDLALHVLRTRALASGQTLSGFTAGVADRLGISARILPATDDRVATEVATNEGTLAFQDYFVRLRCQPIVSSLAYRGAELAAPAPGVLEALSDPNLAMIIIAPSNPYLSIEPILAIPGIRQALLKRSVPAIAVTPVIQGEAVKGPTAKIMSELGVQPSALTVAQHYDGLIDGFLLDTRDASLLGELPMAGAMADTLMQTLEDRERVARAALALGHSLNSGTGEKAP
ncbi:MAG: 2-phospho-L-lactate transferase [Massilia sp.]